MTTIELVRKVTAEAVEDTSTEVLMIKESGVNLDEYIQATKDAHGEVDPDWEADLRHLMENGPL